MTIWICATCGVEHPDSPEPPPGDCAICADERQYIPHEGQSWISLDQLSAQPHATVHREHGFGVHALYREPEFAIGQHSYLVQTAEGNLLWDPPNYLDAEILAIVRKLGGAAVIAASHPHMFGSQVSWSTALGGARVLVNAADRAWVRRADAAIESWDELLAPLPGITLVRLGGHFPGSAVAHLDDAAGGTLLVGDTIGGAAAEGWLTFLRSYPNRIPLSANIVRRIADSLEPYAFERLFGLGGKAIRHGAAHAVRRSAQRHIDRVTGAHDELT
ncbi:hydrolase [Sciscionella sediminilitoris]|uniref:hydrolase n=1 Tax=Sciscionella sediminilitoris TaxID=1445613 RepID=UPI0004DED4BD|nr:hydrolase [Sciscionella sp. SE31]